MSTAIVISLILALLIGAACRWFNIPLPAPTRLSGALLLMAMTLGFVIADHIRQLFS